MVFNYLSMIYRNVIHKLPNRCGVEITRVVYDSIYCVVNLNFGKCVINKKWPSNSFKYKQRILFALLFYRSDKISWQHPILLSMKFACNKRSTLVNLQIFTKHINTRHSQKSLNCGYKMNCHYMFHTIIHIDIQTFALNIYITQFNTQPYDKSNISRW